MAGQTLSEQIYEELYHDITDQRLICGQKLTLKMLKERFDVSHTPIREALMRLAENGLVTYYSNCGVTVTEFTESDIRQLYQFIGELDSMAIIFCRNNFNQMPLLMDLQEVVDMGEKALVADDRAAWKVQSERFHVVFYRHAQNSYLDEAAEKLRARLEVLSCMYYGQDQNMETIHKGHVQMYELVRAGEFEQAAEEMRRHLQRDMAFALKAYAAYQTKNR